MRYRRSPSAAVLGVTIAGALALAPATAGGHTARFEDRVTINRNPDFHGRVISQRSACEEDRKVRIYREQQGPDGLFASTRTDGDGRWELLVTQLTGDFYAKIGRRNIGSSGHQHLCKGDRSKTVHVQAPPPP